MWPFGKSTEERVKDAIKEHPATSQMPVTVTERGGTVTFQGEVPNEAAGRLLGLIAEGIKGVKSVDTSDVTVTQPVAQDNYQQDTGQQDTGQQDTGQQDTGQADGSQSYQEPAYQEPVFIPTTSQDQPYQEPSGGFFNPQAMDGGVAELQKAIDASATAKKVLRALEANVELQDNPIDVLQSGSSVVLRGAVDSQHEFNLALKLAQGVAGVRGVDSSGLRVVEGAKEKAKVSLAEDEAVSRAKPPAPKAAAPKAAAPKATPKPAPKPSSPARPAAAAPVNVPDEYYTVQAGDTLSGIALQFYGDASREAYMRIAKANGIGDPDRIKAGQRLQIPR